MGLPKFLQWVESKNLVQNNASIETGSIVIYDVGELGTGDLRFGAPSNSRHPPPHSNHSSSISYSPTTISGTVPSHPLPLYKNIHNYHSTQSGPSLRSPTSFLPPTTSPPLNRRTDSCLRKYLSLGRFDFDFSDLLSSVQRDLDAFKRSGLRVVCVFDGQTEPDKMDTWLSRRREDLKKVLQLQKELAGGAVVSKVSNSAWKVPISTTKWVADAFDDVLEGKDVHRAIGDADCEAAALSQSEDAFGVITGDSDLLFFPGVK